MIRRKLEKRYARALFNSIVDTAEYSAVMEQLEELEHFFSHEKDIFEFLSNPINNITHKFEIINKMKNTLQLAALTVNFIDVLIRRQKLSYYSGIVEAVKKLHNEHTGIAYVEVITAFPLSEQAKQKLLNAIEAHIKKKIVLQQKVDASLIGGIITKIDSTVYDGSLRRQLELIKRKILFHT